MQPITTPSSSIPLSNCSPSPPHHHHHHLITATILFLSRLWLASSCVFLTRSAHHRSPALCPPLMDGGAPRPESEVPSFIVIYFLLLFVKARLFPLLPTRFLFSIFYLYATTIITPSTRYIFSTFICMARLLLLYPLAWFIYHLFPILLFEWSDNCHHFNTVGKFVAFYFLLLFVWFDYCFYFHFTL